MKNLLIVVAVLAYFVWPIDLCPGLPIDDIVVVILGIAAMRNNGSSNRKEKIEMKGDWL